MPLFDVVAVVAEVYGPVCTYTVEFAGTRLWRHKSCVVTNYI